MREANFPAKMAVEERSKNQRSKNKMQNFGSCLTADEYFSVIYCQDRRGVLVIDWACLSGYDGAIRKRARSFYMEMQRRCFVVNKNKDFLAGEHDKKLLEIEKKLNGLLMIDRMIIG